MRLVELDGNRISHMYEIHDAFAAALHFPEYYGRNLDALYDCLTDLHEETVVGISAPSALKEKLVSHYGRLMNLLSQVEEDNPFIRVVVFPDEAVPDEVNIEQ